MRYLIGFLAAILLAVVVGLGVMLTGAYNVAASEPHSSLGRWILDTTYHRSVAARADDAPVRPELMRAANFQEGFAEYQEYCVHCHGGPGAERHEWTQGMRPMPPSLTHAAREMSPAEIFWIVKHGVKMSGMPAFGATESDETIRNIVAFVTRLDEITPEQYQRLQQQSGASAEHEHGPGGHSGSSE